MNGMLASWGSKWRLAARPSWTRARLSQPVAAREVQRDDPAVLALRPGVVPPRVGAATYMSP